MTVLTAHEVADAWRQAGGMKSRVTEWVAIAMGESSFDTGAVSVDGALGLWQIMPFNWAPNGVDINRWQDPVANATVAVRMSGRGRNCAAWDSCYADIAVSGRYTYLAWPESGSADYHNMTIVSALLGTDKGGGGFPPEPNVGLDGAAQAAAKLDAITTRMFGGLHRKLVHQRHALNMMGRNGWRP